MLSPNRRSNRQKWVYWWMRTRPSYWFQRTVSMRLQQSENVDFRYILNFVKSNRFRHWDNFPQIPHIRDFEIAEAQIEGMGKIVCTFNCASAFVWPIRPDWLLWGYCPAWTIYPIIPPGIREVLYCTPECLRHLSSCIWPQACQTPYYDLVFLNLLAPTSPTHPFPLSVPMPPWKIWV